nr:hypothetical protein [Tanacetum cinerariifolium]
MDLDAAHMVAALKVPMLKPGEFELWRMRIKHNDVNTAQVVNVANGVNTASSQVNAASSLNIDNLSDAVIYAFMASQSNNTHLVNKDLEQIHPDDLEEMDLKWQMAMLTITARRFLKNTRRKLNLNGNDSVAFDKTKVKCYNCHKKATLQGNIGHQGDRTTEVEMSQEGLCQKRHQTPQH